MGAPYGGNGNCRRGDPPPEGYGWRQRRHWMMQNLQCGCKLNTTAPFTGRETRGSSACNKVCRCSVGGRGGKANESSVVVRDHGRPVLRGGVCGGAGSSSSERTRRRRSRRLGGQEGR